MDFKKIAISVVTIGFIGSLSFASTANAESSTLEWDGFVDVYYAYDFNEPSDSDRSFTTSPARHNEFNLNLAHIGVTYTDETVRARLALQVGTSVEANYTTEPLKGQFSNEDMVKHIQEAYVGTKIGENTWIDAGIFFSHIGLESFKSLDNMTYTRSLVADFSPYYQAGVRLHHDFSDKLSGELLILNGWQIVTDDNSDKALGTKLSYAFTDDTSLSYSTFVGREAEFRHFHDLVLVTKLTDVWNIAVQADIGFQKKSNSSRNSSWYGATLISNYILNEKTTVSNRFEVYWDKDQVIVSSGTGDGFKVWSGSVGVDRRLNDRTVWRNEFRYFSSQDEIYPRDINFTKDSSLLVSSISVTL